MPRSDRSTSWVLRLWLVVGAFAVVTLVRSWQVGIPLRDPHGAILVNRLALTAGIFAVLVVIDGVLRTTRRRSLRAVVTTVRQRWTGRRLLLAACRAAGLPRRLLLLPQPQELGRPQLAPRTRCCSRWDRWLFLGHSPAVLLHDLLGQHVAAYSLLVVYESFSTLVSISFVAARGAHRPDPRRLRLHRVDWCACGSSASASYYAIPSLGPFHSAPRGVRGAAAHDDPGHPGAVPRPARRTCWPTRTRTTPSPRSRRSRACTSPSPALILLMARYYGLRLLDAGCCRASSPAPCWPRSTSAGTSPSTTWRAC